VCYNKKKQQVSSAMAFTETLLLFVNNFRWTYFSNILAMTEMIEIGQ
jgi:hypothetical protein